MDRLLNEEVVHIVAFSSSSFRIVEIFSWSLMDSAGIYSRVFTVALFPRQNLRHIQTTPSNGRDFFFLAFQNIGPARMGVARRCLWNSFMLIVYLLSSISTTYYEVEFGASSSTRTTFRDMF